ncbi:hypothetical protein [Virgibacillus salexigens]|uniref:hypothetical protein n=1 Tax=Virgibacillus massiliensis TaxID=1462526 RepID=UPI001370353F|nr:hypothetical protein [Virgibacillus massiliensis]MYL43893.1 hypothetical protein [Virgibacillus massiliensis]
MKFSYENKGDILYGIEEFRFRYSGRETATIKVLNLLDDNQYAYEFEVMEHYKLPDKIDKYQASFSSANMELHEELNIKHQPVFNTKQEALQHAIDSLNAIMKLCRNK